MKILAVSQRIDRVIERDEVRDSLDQRLVEFLGKAADAVVPIPNVFENAGPDDIYITRLLRFLEDLAPYGIVLSGGNDLGEYSDRDSTENALLDYAENESLPVLGICRGMQFMAHRFGVELQQVDNHVATRHLINGEINQEVNSFHKWSVASCPRGFNVIAKSRDETIEAIRRIDLSWEGWMWHPERESPFKDSDIRRLRRLFG